MGTYNRRIKFGLKIPNHLGKMPVKIGGGRGFFDSHCTCGEKHCHHQQQSSHIIIQFLGRYSRSVYATKLRPHQTYHNYFIINIIIDVLDDVIRRHQPLKLLLFDYQLQSHTASAACYKRYLKSYVIQNINSQQTLQITHTILFSRA